MSSFSSPLSSYIPYSQRPGWEDVVPIPQVEAEGALVPIMYSQEYADVTSIFRALSSVSPPEHSRRALDITEHVIRLNPAHYTVWQYRFQTLLAINADLMEELEWSGEFARDNLKSYQVWHHRLLLMTHIEPELPLLRQEIDFIHAALLPDAKNYHTWAYLHWLFSHFDKLGRFRDEAGQRTIAEEIEWCELMLDSEVTLLNPLSVAAVSDGADYGENDDDDDEINKGDGRNNSAWAWRWYLMISRNGAEKNTDKEIQYALDQITRIPHNASAWNYLRGIHEHFEIEQASCLAAILPFTDPSTATPSSPRPVPFALEWLAEVKADEETDESRREAARLYDDLGNKWDRMRVNYWRYKRMEVLKRSKANK